MRSAIRILTVALLAVGGIAITALPGGAGAPVSPHNTVKILKDVVGTPPTGATFTVALDCVSNLNPVSIQKVVPTVSFNASGTATTTNSFDVPAGQTCTVTETETAGASSVAYACAITRGQSDPTPPFLGKCTGTNVVSFGDVIGDSATITVTNTFVAAPTTTTTTTKAPPPPAVQAVRASPTFTG